VTCSTAPLTPASSPSLPTLPLLHTHPLSGARRPCCPQLWAGRKVSGDAEPARAGSSARGRARAPLPAWQGVPGQARAGLCQLGTTRAQTEPHRVTASPGAPQAAHAGVTQLCPLLPSTLRHVTRSKILSDNSLLLLHCWLGWSCTYR